MTLILGINAYHGDSSACLLVDGQLVAAVEEERFRRIKHWAGFPSESIKYCLGESGINISDIEHVAINSNPTANLFKKAAYTLYNRPDLKFIYNRILNTKKRTAIISELCDAFPDAKFKGRIHYIEHHLSHLSSCYYVSPFKKAITVSMDGFGDFASTAWGVGEGGGLSIDRRINFPHSLGIFYQALTQYLGFPNYGDEYKVMGLAPYGSMKYLNDMRDIVKLQEDGGFKLNLKYFRHHKEKIDYKWAGGTPIIGELFSNNLEQLLGPKRNIEMTLDQRHKDIARSVQAMYEEAFYHILNTLHRKYNINDLALAGGCAMNSVANGKIYRNTPFKRVYIQSAAGDAGGAIGAAYVVYNNVESEPDRYIMDHAYLGPHFSNNDILKVLNKRVSEFEKLGCTIKLIEDEEKLCQITAQNISDAKVVGWFQGRMEWGPRALGNRSILCDPRRPDIKDILNNKIKRRESFRPFAPSILRNAVQDWFEEDDDVPFMMKVFQIKKEKRNLIPAVTHVDGSGRLQTVYKETNQRYYKLIQYFNNITGIPIVLNTSFNENEPVVCKPDEAIDCFLRTKMDVLVIGDYYISRSPM